ncbi:MAG: PIN domain protein [Chitinivibrionia bacterium]|nr:PIN domain protein [Chitinivibrionia bacterium]
MVNKIKSLFLDTSVFGGYYDEIFMRETRLLFDKIKAGKYNVFISDLVEKELKKAPENVKNLLNEINYNLIDVTTECENLADEYIKEKVVGKTSRDDCIHIATATIFKIDYLISWNYKHILRAEKTEGYNSVNLKNGYKHLDIHSPREMEVYDDK